MKKIMLVFGTRPEAIKMAPLVKEFQKHPYIESIVCVTGQHRQMLDHVLSLFEITPDNDLNIMKQGQDLYDVTARVLTGMRDVLAESKPDVILEKERLELSLIEGCMFAKPLVTNRIASVLEVNNNGKNGLAFDSFEELAKEINRLYMPNSEHTESYPFHLKKYMKRDLWKVSYSKRHSLRLDINPSLMIFN